jgi:hypothetical protein
MSFNYSITADIDSESYVRLNFKINDVEIGFINFPNNPNNKDSIFCNLDKLIMTIEQDKTYVFKYYDEDCWYNIAHKNKILSFMSGRMNLYPTCEIQLVINENTISKICSDLHTIYEKVKT